VAHAAPTSYGVVITCEHGGNRIPAPYRYLFQALRALLDSHRGFDPGALILAKTLAKALAAPLVTATVSRLLVDLNRSVGHPHLHGEPMRRASAEQRQRILRHQYHPYRERVMALVKQAVGDRGRAIHLACHSFTPVLNGKVRNADIGLLYDPARGDEANLCRRWKAALEACEPPLVVRRNYPYAGKDDGLTTWLRRCFPTDAYLGVELEINQKHLDKAGRHWPALRKQIAESLCKVLLSCDAGIGNAARQDGVPL
jgi:predicted N-formylglutamate amidohydrolase